MEQYNVTGMSCAACVARVEKAVSKLEGVESCSVSLLTNSMGVEGTVAPEEVIRAVAAAGYGATRKSAQGTTGKVPQDSSEEMTGAAEQEALQNAERKKLRTRLLWSLGFLAVLMYFSMGCSMWGFPVPRVLQGNHIAMGLLQLLLTTVVMVINQRFFVSGYQSLFHMAPNMDTLVALGASAAYGYSTYVLFAMTDAQVKGDMVGLRQYGQEFYFESAAMILTLITVGKLLEARSKGKTTDALKNLMKLAPRTATLLKEGVEVIVPAQEVKIGDIFVVKPGELIPVDGIVLDGSSAVNESALTGESIPVDKEPGGQVSAATVNQSGYLRCRATRVGQDTTLAQIITMVTQAATTKAPIAKIADRVSGVFVPIVIGLAILTTVIWLAQGLGLGYALARGISVLVISCPCALGLATPVAIMVGNGVGAKNGILFKTAVSLEETGKISIIALDKTGTITTGETEVTNVIPVKGVTRKELLKMAFALESKSEHPLARAIVKLSNKEAVEKVEVQDFRVLPGNGLAAMWQGKLLLGGSMGYVEKKAVIPVELQEQARKLSLEGKTPLCFVCDSQVLGIIAVADTIKEDSPQAISELKQMGLHVVMLTGDNERTAKAIGDMAGVDEVIAGVLPEGKEKAVVDLMKQGKVAMVGDGINDAPALTRADIGIAIGAGTDVAIDAAQVVLMKNSLRDVAVAIRLSRATLRNIKQNLFWAFFYNAIGIPLAMGALIPWGITLNPMFGAGAMSLSSFCVVSNALRLNFVKLYKSFGQQTINQQETQHSERKMEDKKMKKTIKIEGMMCGHCSSRVKKALEELEQVTEAVVSHEEGLAEVYLTEEVSHEMLKKVVEEQDYKVVEIC